MSASMPPTPPIPSTEKAGRAKLIRNPWVTGVAGLVVGLLIGVAAGSSTGSTTAGSSSPSVVIAESPTAASPIEESPAESPTEAPSESSGELGSRENPIPLGDAGTVGDNWEITVTSVNENADEAIHKANQFNEKPGEGRQYVMVTVRAKYLGGGKGEAFYDLTYGVSGDSGTVYEAASVVLPDDISDSNSLFSGDAAEGNVAFEVEKSQISSLVLLVSPSFGSVRTAFAL